MRIGFAGTPDFARIALQAILDAGHTVELVLTQPDRPAGRGMKLQASPVKQLAEAQGIGVLQPQSLRLDGRYAQEAAHAQIILQSHKLDVLVVAAYGLILPQWVLESPVHGCLNIHASLLPRWRGAAPIHRAIEAGDVKTGITIMQMDEGLDTGDMVSAESMPIHADDTTGTLHDRLADLGGALIVQEALADLRNGPLATVPQPDNGITYAHKINKSESWINWEESATTIARRVRAFNPFPAAQTLLNEHGFKVWSAEVLTQPKPPNLAIKKPGEILHVDAKGIDVSCGEGTVLRLTELQRAGSKRMAMAQLLNGLAIQIGDQFHADRTEQRPEGHS